MSILFSEMYSIRLLTSSRVLPNVTTGVIGTSGRLHDQMKWNSTVEVSKDFPVVRDVASTRRQVDGASETKQLGLSADEGLAYMKQEEYKQYLPWEFNAGMTAEEAAVNRAKFALRHKINQQLQHKVLCTATLIVDVRQLGKGKSVIFDKIREAESLCREEDE
eukprot:TRINITY_DN696_c0_g1_i2.p1 TRINITY_DN696_c0_g1~~TRINITY_DN696_c0_g1_i2.p1  ORF type:complete len:163 (+),score=33.32 TRINITY_DN696_c0_g1_i2:61-549(+)